MTSQWAQWRLKSPASRLFTQPFIQTEIKENIKSPCHCPLWPVNSPHKGPCNAENVFIWWRHHVRYVSIVFSPLCCTYASMNWVSIGSGNSLSPPSHYLNCLLSIGLLGTTFREIWIGILTFSPKKFDLKIWSARMAAILSRGRWVNWNRTHHSWVISRVSGEVGNQCPHYWSAWRRHQVETFSALLAICAGNSPVTCKFPSQRTVRRSFGVFFDLRVNKWLSKQSWGWWSETPSRSLWRHCNVNQNNGQRQEVPFQ